MLRGVTFSDDIPGDPSPDVERTASYLARVTEKVKSNLLTLTEHHNSDIGSLLESLANDKTKLTLVQAKLSSVLTTVEEYRSENALVR